MYDDKLYSEPVFLCSFRAVFVWLCPLFGLSFLGGFLIGFQAVNPSAIVAFLIAYLVCLVSILPLVTLLLVWRCRVRLAPGGALGWTHRGTPVFMNWSEMEAVEPRHLFGLPYLRITSFRESCPPLWLPRFLATPKAFQEAVAAHTSPLHPLRQSLENGSTAKRRDRLPAQ